MLQNLGGGSMPSMRKFNSHCVGTSQVLDELKSAHFKLKEQRWHLQSDGTLHMYNMGL